MFPSSVIDTFIIKILTPRETLMKIGTLQYDMQRLKIQSMIGLSENHPSLTLLEKEALVERACSVLHVHKCAKIAKTVTQFLFCTEVLV